MMRKPYFAFTARSMWSIRATSVLLLVWCVLVAREARGQHAPHQQQHAPPQKLDSTPELRAVHRAALSHHDLSGRESSDRLGKRIRRANLLPEIELRSMWRIQDEEENDYREDLDFDDLGFAVQDSARHDTKVGTTTQDTYSVGLRFELSGLVFDPRELEVERLHAQKVQRRERLLTLINELYYARTHYIARKRELDLDEEERLLHDMHIARCEADLDALTGGWFTSQLEGHDHEK